MRTILVTGGAGFIGSHLVDELMKRGYKVVVLDDLSAGKVKNIHPWIKNDNFVFIKGSLLRKKDIRHAMKDCDTVFHLAGNADVRIGVMDSTVHYEQNVVCTYNILEAMRESQLCRKIIFTSTSTVYGEPTIMPTPESYGPLIPISLYGASKLACESLIAGYCNSFDFAGSIARLANIIGPRSTHGVVFDFIRKLRKNPAYLEVLGDGRQTKSYLHVYDCVSGLIAMGQKSSGGKVDIYNIGSVDRIS
ncbi:MAG: SDR family NAD(P)-dependent oxidoreductase, partial [Nitrososphaera sp.]